MSFRHCLVVCAVLMGLCYVESAQKRMFPLTRFSCIGKPTGYYADVDTGCQVYHMCDGMGRQFSYKCPNMTLFQQRMLICDHWYMVNCSMSERDYDANLLIGQRDKPFVSDDEMRLRTPRPDILAVPPYNPYYDVLKLDTKVDEVEENDLDTKQTQNHFRPQENHRRQDTVEDFASDEHNQAVTKKPARNFKPTRSPLVHDKQKPRQNSPSVNLLPPFAPRTQSASEELYDEAVVAVEASLTTEVPVLKFLKRFNPNEEEYKTAMSKSEILNLNSQLPLGQASSEEDKNTRKFKNYDNKLNTFKNDKTFSAGSRFDSVNTKPNAKPPAENVFKTDNKIIGAQEPVTVLLPPNAESQPIASTTIGPPVYYEWRWAVPAFELIPPKESNTTDFGNIHQEKSVNKPEGRNPFSSVTRPEPITTTPEPSHVEYNISSYFIPDYVFPLDKGHPGYDSDDAQTSFKVNVARPGRASYGENPDCPQCHPAYLSPGSCEPCVIER